MRVIPKIVNTALKAKAKAWTFEAKAKTKATGPEAKAKAKAIKFGLEAKAWPRGLHHLGRAYLVATRTARLVRKSYSVHIKNKKKP